MRRHDKNYILSLYLPHNLIRKLGETVYRVYKQGQPTDKRWGYNLAM
jgi:hypothetical protein